MSERFKTIKQPEANETSLLEEAVETSRGALTARVVSEASPLPRIAISGPWGVRPREGDLNG